MLSETVPKVIVIGGATSAGKSAVSMEICKLLNAEIVISDSVQVYRGMDVGSNKPTSEDQTVVKHHLIDIADISEPMNTGIFSQLAAETIHEIIRRGKVPIVVGGSTMWMQWLVHGVPDAPKASIETVQTVNNLINEFEVSKRWDDALAVLNTHNPTMASKLFPNDWYRLRRYLEVAIDTASNSSKATDLISDSQEQEDNDGGNLSGEREQLLRGLDVRCFFLMESRADLYHTIDDRCQTMLHRGLLEEVTQLLLEDKLRPEYTVSRAIGYRQTIEYLLNPSIQDNDWKAFRDFVVEFATATRNYARKQHNWYRRDKEFLFLTMNRSAAVTATSTLDPYETVAQEIMHWIELPREEFDDHRQQQSTIGKIISTLVKQKKIALDYEPKSTQERDIILELINMGLLRVTANDSDVVISQTELQEQLRARFGVESEQHPSKSLTTSESTWTADHPLIRVGEDIDGGKFMRTYYSKLQKLDEETLIPLVRQADELRHRLLSEVPASLYDEFKSKF